ncbi:MAG: hypothetical protein NDJ89_15905 [Oligoflexia bacterium]|nr:hypothetical protein [Oligoflexia bacterium]
MRLHTRLLASLLLAIFLNLAPERAFAQSTRDLEHFLRVGRLHFYLEELVQRLDKSGAKELAERLKQITPEQLSSWDPPTDARGFDPFIQKQLQARGWSAEDAGKIGWDYPFLKNKLNEAFRTLDAASSPPGTLSQLPDTAQPLKMNPLDGSAITFNAEMYIESRTTRAIFWDMAENGTSMELHLGSMRDFNERLDRRGGKILKEIRPWSRNYNKIFLVQYPGEAPKYAISGISGYDRLEHLAHSFEIASWNGKKTDWKSPKAVTLYGDLADKLKKDAAELTAQMINLPRPDRVVIGQKGQIEKAFQAAAKAQAILELSQLAPQEVEARLNPAQRKLLKAMKSAPAPFRAFENAPDWQKMHDALKPLLDAKGVKAIEARDFAISNPSHNLADYLFRTKDGKLLRWRLIENVWGDETLPIAEAVKAAGYERTPIYIGTAGAIPGKNSLNVGELFVPSEVHTRIASDTLKVKPPLAPPSSAKIGGRLENVGSPFEETALWLSQSQGAGSRAVELEVGYLEKVLPDVEPYLLISDKVGSEGQTLDRLDSGKLRRARTAELANLFKVDGAFVPAARTAPSGPLEVIVRAFPQGDPAWHYQLLQLGKEKAFAKRLPLTLTEDGARALAQESPAFTSKLLTDRLSEGGAVLARLWDRAQAEGIELKPYVSASVAKGTFHPRKEKLALLLHVPDAGDAKRIEGWLTELRKDPKLAKLLTLAIARGPPPEGDDWARVEGLLDGRLSRAAVRDLYARAAYANAGMVSALGAEGPLKLQAVPTTGKLAACTPAEVSCHLQYFPPDDETKKLLAKFVRDDALDVLRTAIEPLEVKYLNLEDVSIRIVDDVPSLPDGALAEIVPELDETGHLTVVMKFTPEGAKNSMVVREELLHLRQIIGKTRDWDILGKSFTQWGKGALDDGYDIIQKRLGSPWGWLEWVLNARAGSVPAQYQLALLERDVAQEIFTAFQEGGTPEESAYAAKRLGHAERKLREIEPKYKAWKRTARQGIEAQKKLQKALDAQKDKIDAMIARNDRKGVAALVRQYLPWSTMEPSEKVAWRQWLDAIENPSTNPKDKLVLVSGLNRDLLKKSSDGKSVFVMSKVLEKGQGNYNFRLRRLESMHEEIGRRVGITEGPTSLVAALHYHAKDPRGSPFRSLTPNPDVAMNFSPPMGVFYMDKRRVLPNITGIASEQEYLTVIATFPDEFVHLSEKEISEDELREIVERKLGIKLPVNPNYLGEFNEATKKGIGELWSGGKKISIENCEAAFAKLGNAP